jgi:prepilin-type N-terminal cleavage/methylation domain-containing protein
MIGTLRRTHRDERGFTLVELLIVVTILGILAAVVTTSLIGLTATAKSNACAEELRTVQTAMDALMAKNNITTVTAQATATSTMTTAIGGSPPEALSPNYIRQPTTKGAYTWTAAGAVTAVAGLPGSC